MSTRRASHLARSSQVDCRSSSPGSHSNSSKWRARTRSLTAMKSHPVHAVSLRLADPLGEHALSNGWPATASSSPDLWRSPVHSSIRSCSVSTAAPLGSANLSGAAPPSGGRSRECSDGRPDSCHRDGAPVVTLRRGVLLLRDDRAMRLVVHRNTHDDPLATRDGADPITQKRVGELLASGTRTRHRPRHDSHHQVARPAASGTAHVRARAGHAHKSRVRRHPLRAPAVPRPMGAHQEHPGLHNGAQRVGSDCVSQARLRCHTAHGLPTRRARQQHRHLRPLAARVLENCFQ